MDVLATRSQHPDDVVYEESILRDPHSVKTWIRYVEFKNDSPSHEINRIYERALKELPGSYKLWHSYILKRCEQVRGLNVLDPEYDRVNDTFEKAMVFMNKMPRLWIIYLEFLLKQQCLITQTRHTFDRALRSLPITQHYRIWPLYLTFVQKFRIPEMGVRVFRRYLKLFPENAEEYVQYLIEIRKFDSAAVELTKIVNNDLFVSIKGKSKYEMWNELCEIISKNPREIHSLNVDAIIRSGLRRYTDQLGNLWCSLADYYIRSGLFDKARDIYEEAIETVTTVRDFTQVFDAYSQFEEFSLKSKMQQVAESDANAAAEDNDIDLEFRLSRFEYLIERRLLLLNSVLLRQNPHNVAEWHKRVSLYEGKPMEIINTYTEAVQTVDPKHAVGKLHTLWIEFAKFYEKNNQIEEARLVFEKAVLVPFVRVDDLATVWCLWCEMEIRNHNFEEAIRLMQRATAPPKKKAVNYYDQCESAQNRVHKSLKVWSLYADLEENFGTFKTCKTVYDQILDTRIATPQIVMNYGLFLEENNYFKEAFKAYEKGVSLFKWPNVCDIWSTYLVKYINRYQGTKVEGTRDLFDQCLENCPEKYAKKFYFLYAKFEENYGLSKNAMAIYEKAANKVLPEESMEVFDLYIKKAAELFGVHKTREIYEKAIETLEDRYAREMCLKFAEMERKLGEIDRARAIYKHCSQLCDPRFTSKFWNIWKEFEIKFGNEDTMREMGYIKRSVEATYNTKVNIMIAQTTNPGVLDDGAEDVSSEVSERQSDVMRKLEEKVIGFVKSTEVISNQKAHHPEDIDLDIDTDEESGSENDVN